MGRIYKEILFDKRRNSKTESIYQCSPFFFTEPNTELNIDDFNCNRQHVRDGKKPIANLFASWNQIFPTCFIWLERTQLCLVPTAHMDYGQLPVFNYWIIWQKKNTQQIRKTTEITNLNYYRNKVNTRSRPSRNWWILRSLERRGTRGRTWSSFPGTTHPFRMWNCKSSSFT